MCLTALARVSGDGEERNRHAEFLPIHFILPNRGSIESYAAIEGAKIQNRISVHHASNEHVRIHGDLN